jgi:solute carrier family 45 protein 1/2/4
MGRKVIIIEDAVRTGSLASLVFAVFAFTTSIIAPTFISSKGKGRASRFKPPIQRAWSISQLLLAFCLFSTILIRDRRAAMMLTAVVGISWAFALWVPFAMIGQEIATRQEQNANIMEGDIGPAQQDQAGAIMGLHNTAISLPQIIAALTSSVIFWIVKSLGSEDGIGWVLRVGGCAALVASWLSSRMER